MRLEFLIRHSPTFSLITFRPKTKVSNDFNFIFGGNITLRSQQWGRIPLSQCEWHFQLIPENENGWRFSWETEEMKRETVNNGELVSEDYKMYDSAQLLAFKSLMMFGYIFGIYLYIDDYNMLANA